MQERDEAILAAFNAALEALDLEELSDSEEQGVLTAFSTNLQDSGFYVADADKVTEKNLALMGSTLRSLRDETPRGSDLRKQARKATQLFDTIDITTSTRTR